MTNQYQHENVTLNIREEYVHPVYGRIFTASFDKCPNLYHENSGPMTSGQAIAYKVAAEKRTWEMNRLPHIDAQTGVPVAFTVRLSVEIHPL